jgi:alpha-glucosidase (family GH31 glycosyl hydrolase)
VSEKNVADAVQIQAGRMDARRVVSGEHWRIGVLTDYLVRFEWSDSGRFVDDPTQVVVNRDFAADSGLPDIHDLGEWLEIRTQALTIRFNKRRFSAEGLWVSSRPLDGISVNWHYGMSPLGNLKGTARTLDGADGPIQLDLGIVSFQGWAVLDDTHSNLVRTTSTDPTVPAPLRTDVRVRQSGSEDFYLFAYGHDYKRAIQDYYRLTGPMPLLPRFALGNWWSRFHSYDEREYKALIERFERENLPFTVAVLDMDWHLVNVAPKYGSGWTGFTWNRELFPEPKEFLDWLHSRGLRTSLNVHPADGIREYEIQYESLAERMMKSGGEPIPFDVTSQQFMTAFFDVVNHPLEDEGVDFWWLDWQQGTVTTQPGLDPLWMLNYLYFLDASRDDRRPLILSRYAGPGSHRFPIGFSGDTVISWKSLEFQPYFTATASNIGYGWWSHDIGGHMAGAHDEELAVRWMQLGVFSPICRLHSNDSLFNGKEPWNYGPEHRHAIESALRLRHALIPYLYTMNRRAAFEGLPLVEPMYWSYPNQQDAYSVRQQFAFGTELMVAPIVRPIVKESQLAKAEVWFPEGIWFDFFTGRRYESNTRQGRRMNVWRPLEQIPVFAHAGAIIPMQTESPARQATALNSVANPVSLTVLLFPGADGEFQLWEDDGSSSETWSCTALHWTQHVPGDRQSLFAVDPAEGSTATVPPVRDWRIVLRGTESIPADQIHVRIGDRSVTPDVTYDSDTLSLSISVVNIPSVEGFQIEILPGAHCAENDIEKDAYTILRRAQLPYVTKDRAFEIIKTQGVSGYPSLFALEARPVVGLPESFGYSHMSSDVREALTEVMFRSCHPE